MNDWETRLKLVTLSERHIIEYAVSKGLDWSSNKRLDCRWAITDPDVRKLFESDSEVFDSAFGNGTPDEEKTIAVRDREHLDALLGYVQVFLMVVIGGMTCDGIVGIEGNVVMLGLEIDLNFLDVSKVTDVSGLFRDFDISPTPEKNWHYKIRLDISKWDVSNVTKMAHMFDGRDYVDFGDLSKWDRSKVTDC